MKGGPFDKSIIKDHNSEGFDSVDSEDFDPGFGCVVHENVTPPAPPPEIKQRELTEYEKWNQSFEKLTESQREQRQDEFLKSHGII